MKLELDWLDGDRSPCIVSRCQVAWCFRQADWPRKIRDLRIHDPAIPLLCDWLRRVAMLNLAERGDGRRWLGGDEPPTTIVPEFRWASRDQKPVILEFEERVSGGRRAAAAMRVEGAEPAVRFEPYQAVYLLGMVEQSVLWWDGFGRQWEYFRPRVTGTNVERQDDAPHRHADMAR